LDIGLSTASSALAGVMIARYLGPSDYGVLSIAISLSLVFSALAELNASPFLLAHSHDDETLNKAFGTALRIQAVAAVLAALPFVALAYSLNSLLIPLCCLAGAVGVLSETRVVLQVKDRYRLLALTGLITTLVGLVARITMVMAQWPLVAFGAILLLENAMRALLCFWAARRFGLRVSHMVWSRKISQNFLRITPVAASAAVFGVLFLKFDPYLLSYFRGAAEVGHFAIAERGSILLMNLLTALFLPLATDQFSAVARSPSFALKELFGSIKSILAWSGAVTAAAIVASSPLIRLFLGESFAPAAAPLKTLVMALPLLIYGLVFINFLWATGERRLIFIRLSLLVALKIGALLILANLTPDLIWLGAANLISLVVILLIFDLPLLAKLQAKHS
jgi:O-antigen/teichoic acid export membrane protein